MKEALRYTSSAGDSLAGAIWGDVQAIRSRKPLVLNVTNFVSMDILANGLLALGASPLMAHAPEELPEIVAISQSLVVNMGTLDENWIHSMSDALKIAGIQRKPSVLDPVGAPASTYRKQVARDLLSLGPTVVRANASEVLALCGKAGTGRGADSTASPAEAEKEAQCLSDYFSCAVAMTGKTDFIIHRNRIAHCRNGNEALTQVTATGCLLSAMTGAFLAVSQSPFEACLHATAYLGICGEVAARDSRGPGSFRVNLIDALAGITRNQIAERLQVDIQ